MFEFLWEMTARTCPLGSLDSLGGGLGELAGRTREEIEVVPTATARAVGLEHDHVAARRGKWRQHCYVLQPVCSGRPSGQSALHMRSSWDSAAAAGVALALAGMTAAYLCN